MTDREETRRRRTGRGGGGGAAAEAGGLGGAAPGDPRGPGRSCATAAGEDPGIACATLALVHSPARVLPKPGEDPAHSVVGKRKSATLLARTYERFLELPVPVVLGAMWLAGAALVSVAALALYLIFSSL